MRVAIHQPHYFPWLGYFDKMAKVERFVLMDEVQLENRSYMSRNRFLNRDGELVYLTVTASKRGYREKRYREIEAIEHSVWQKKQSAYFQEAFRFSPYFEEVMEPVALLLRSESRSLCDITCESIRIVRSLLRIQTPLVRQSALQGLHTPGDEADANRRRSEEVLAICRAAGATAYLTGAGASLAFIEKERFLAAGIPVEIQHYTCPTYPQRHSAAFVPNISALDLLFNCGIAESRRIFWENVKNSNEFGDEID